jgi:hypothetical protein
MNLEIFDKSWQTLAAVRGFRSIGINRRNARVTLSAILVQEMDIKPDMSLFLARNTEAKCEWYIRFDNSSDGLCIRSHKGGISKGVVSLGITSRSITTKLLESCKAERGISLLVAKTPTKINGQEWFQLITSKPLRVN